MRIAGFVLLGFTHAALADLGKIAFSPESVATFLMLMMGGSMIARGGK